MEEICGPSVGSLKSLVCTAYSESSQFFLTVSEREPHLIAFSSYKALTPSEQKELNVRSVTDERPGVCVYKCISLHIRVSFVPICA